MNQFPECSAIFSGHRIDAVLRPRQERHWLHLFSCQFDDNYVSSALRIGNIHSENKVAPYLYLAGNNFFHCQLIKLTAEHYENVLELQGLRTAIARLITLDTELALAAYTRAICSHNQRAA